MTLLVCLFLVHAIAVPWYAQYDLPESQIELLKEQGCFRGLFGGMNGDPRTLSLTTCATQEAQEPFAVTPDDAFLCVVELNSHHLHDSAQEIVATHGAKTIFVGHQELVIANPTNHSEIPDVCCVTHFERIANNVLYVPRVPIKPTQPFPADHPILQRFGNASTAALPPNPQVQTLMDLFIQSEVTSYINSLSYDTSSRTGVGSQITRNSYAIGTSCPAGWKCPQAITTWIINTVNSMFTTNSYPISPIITTSQFRSDMCSNIIVRIPGTVTQTTVIVGAHLDSRMAINTRTTDPAPGADDNASGSAMNMELLNAIAKSRYRFQYAIEIQFYCGEEQGLLGSAALAKSYGTEGRPVLGMINADMLGYTKPGTSPTLTFDARYVTPSWVTRCKDAVTLYMPTLKKADSTGCCSDQQSWYNNGFAALGIFETETTDVIYPDYHKTTDAMTNGLINMEQVTLFGKAVMSCLGEFAVPVSSS